MNLRPPCLIPGDGFLLSPLGRSRPIAPVRFRPLEGLCLGEPTNWLRPAVGCQAPAFADRILLAKEGAAPDFARFLIVFTLAEFPLQAAPLQQFLETPQCCTNVFSIVYPHTQGHRVHLRVKE